MSVHAFRYRDTRVQVDRRRQVLHLEVSDTGDLDECPDEPSASPDGRWDFHTGVHFEAPLYPSVAAAPFRSGFAPFAAFAEKARIFDQGLQGAIEVMAHEGAIGILGRRHLTPALRAGVAEGAGARALLDAGAALLGEALPEDAGPRAAAQGVLRGFLNQPTRHKPQGLYTWDDRLAVIHDFDHLMGMPLSEGDALALAHALSDRPTLGEAYGLHLTLLDALGGTPRDCDVYGRGPGGCANKALFPSRRWPTEHLAELVFGGALHPNPGAAIDQGLAHDAAQPAAHDDGVIRHQLRAWAALLDPGGQPEARHLHVGPRYRSALREAFKGWAGVTGNPAIKVLEAAPGGPQTPRQHAVPVGPSLSVEPLPEAYRRRAQGYRVLREALAHLLGRGALEQAVRIRTRGTRVPNDLFSELVEMELLFRGAYLISAGEIGMAPQTDGWSALEDDAALARTRRWLRHWRGCEDLSVDLRAMIPVGRDPGRGTVRVQAVLGMTTRDLTARFANPPAVELHCEVPGTCDQPQVTFIEQRGVMGTLAVVECEVRQVLDHQRFRALCDREVTVARIAHALAAL